jgi:branched-subunit amino acid aminotransferase/4-amino-4-deoxychorismate lyase
LQGYINVNGSYIHSDESFINADNRGFRYGDGLFETIKVLDNKIHLAQYHFERLFSSMKILQFDIPDLFSEENLSEQILLLCKKNDHQDSARVRVIVFRGNGKLFDAENNSPNYIIQTEELFNKKFALNENGLVVDVFTDGKKSCDKFSNIKSNNFLVYGMAAIHAKKNGVDDCFILNSHSRVCESTIANIFCIKDKIIYTPALSEGCISGVMRRFLLEKISGFGFLIEESNISIENIKEADEVFLTNSISGIRWVGQFGDSKYHNSLTKEIFKIVF